MFTKLIKACLVSLLSLFAGHASATAQAPDILILNEHTEALNTNPLQSYLEEHPKALPRADFSSSNNWRGYVATWSIEEDMLILKRVDVRFRSPETPDDFSKVIKRNVISDMFPDIERVVAIWYSGALIIPQGKLVNYVHMGYGSTYERYKIIVINKGCVSKNMDLSFKKFDAYKRSQFAAFKKTADYDSRVK